jgi:hypothetical protein
VKKTKGGITVGNGEVMVANRIGDIPCEIMDKHGSSVTTGMMTEVAWMKGLPFNLFSLTKMMKKGWTLRGDKTSGITLAMADKKLVFDIPIETYAKCMRRTEAAAQTQATPMSVEKAHCVLGHQSEVAAQKRKRI